MDHGILTVIALVVCSGIAILCWKYAPSGALWRLVWKGSPDSRKAETERTETDLLCSALPESNENNSEAGQKSTVRLRWKLALEHFATLVNEQQSLLTSLHGQGREEVEATLRKFRRKNLQFQLRSDTVWEYVPTHWCECANCIRRRPRPKFEPSHLQTILAKAGLARESGPLSTILSDARISVNFMCTVYRRGQGAAELKTLIEQCGVTDHKHALQIALAIGAFDASRHVASTLADPMNHKSLRLLALQGSAT